MNKYLKLRITDKLYNNFKKSCKKKNKNMSEVLRSFTNFYSENDNVVLLNLDDETLKRSIKLCKEKKIKFNDLIFLLLKKTLK